MRITAPDGEDNHADHVKVEGDSPTEEVKKTFLHEITLMLKMPEMPSKYIADGVDGNNSLYKLEVLKKFTALCREEIIPRHKTVADTIQSKSDELQRKLIVQKKEIAQLVAVRQELEESRMRLMVTKDLTQSKHEELSDRLKDTLHILKNQCRSKTIAERKMWEDLIQFKKKADDLKVGVTSVAAKANYYSTQVNGQSEITRKQTKPLYLDKNRAVFMRSNLNSMRINIEQMVRRVKLLKNQVGELEPVNPPLAFKD